jgi:hypothetical protein
VIDVQVAAAGALWLHRGGTVRSRAGSWRADIPGSVEVYFGAEPGVRMALKIDTLQCSVGVAALREAGCGVLRPVSVVWARRS